MFGKTLTLILLVASANGALAGSLITTNLPTGTTIVNIDAHADGAANSANNFSDWYQPFAGNVSLTLGPGTYSFTIVNAADAAARFPALTATQLGTIHGAWTYNSPWLSDFLAFDSSAITDASKTQLFSGGDSSQGYNDEASAYAGTKSKGFLGQLHVSPGGRAGGTIAPTYTLSATRTLVFAIPDSGVGDNAGGPSVIVQSVPEPSTVAAMALGGLALLRRRRRG